MKKGVSEQVFYDTAKDFKYKLDECKKCSGVLEARPFEWYYYFFNAEMVASGRLQFHTKKFFDDTYYKWKESFV